MNYLFDETDKLSGVPLRRLNAAMAGFPAPIELPAPATLRGLHKPSGHQRMMRILLPFKRARLRRNIRGWIAEAVKNGPRSVEAEFIAEWSWELRTMFGE